MPVFLFEERAGGLSADDVLLDDVGGGHGGCLGACGRLILVCAAG